MTTQRPALWPLHDLLGTNMVEPEDSLFMQSGYPTGLAVPSGDHNGKLRRSGDYHKYLDLNGLRNNDWLDDGSVFLAYKLTVDNLQYVNGGNVLGAGATVGKRGTYLINATRVETDDTFLNPVGGTVQGSPLVYPLATAPGRIWIYANDAGEVRYDSVGVGVADSPGSDEISLVGVDIDATGAVTDGAVVPTTLALPDRQLGVVIPLWVFGRGRMLRVSVTPDGNPAVLVEGGAGPGQRIDNDHATDPTLELNNSSANGLALLAAGAADLSNNSATTPTLTLANAAGPGLDVTGSVSCNGALAVADGFAFTANGNCTLGNAAGDTITVNGTTTFNAPVTVANGQAFVANGNVTLGNAGTDTCTVNAATTFTAAKTSIGGNEIEGTAGSVVDVENVEVTELRWDSSGTTLPGSPGEIRWNGTFFSYHDQTGVVRTIEEPVRGYDASFSTDLAIADTTATAFRRIQANEPVWIEISCRYEANGAEEMAYRVQVSGPLGTVTIISDDVTIATANKGYPFFQAFLWTPTDDYPGETDPQNYSFTVGLGIGGLPTLTATNVTITVSSYVSV